MSREEQKTDNLIEMLKRDLVSSEDCWNFLLRLVVNQANAEGLEEAGQNWELSFSLSS